jgi:hypothetical protein
MKGIRLDIAVGAVILMPFVTVGLGFRASLIAQAIGISAVAMATLPALATKVGWRRFLHAPRPVFLGIMAVGAATVLGLGVGLIRGHDAVQIAGQALSMGLLPLAAAGGLATWSDSGQKQWRVGLLAALTLGCWVQLIWGFVMIAILGEPSRLFLPNSVSVIGPALLGLCFSVVSLNDPDRRLRRLAWLAMFSILLVILGSSLRSLWILTPMAVVGLAIVWRGLRSRETMIVILIIAALAMGTIGGVWIVNDWASRDRPDALKRSPCALFPLAGTCVEHGIEVVFDREGRIKFDAPVSLPKAKTWRIMVRGHGEGQGALVVALLFFDEQGQILKRIPVSLRATADEEARMAFGTPPRNWAETRLRLSRLKGTMGQWHLDMVECAALESTLMVHLISKVRSLVRRVQGLVRAAATGRAVEDATLGFRLHESLRIVEEFNNASWVQRLFGHGLGATIHLDIDGFDNRGHWIHYDSVNYIHNWYLFLLFKLGIVGLILVLGALVGWIVWTIRSSSPPPSPDVRAFLVAAAASWIVYAIWSLTSPEILDFRMAPLWGWLLSVCVSRAGETRTEEGR